MTKALDVHEKENKLSGKCVLITGGGGFIASHLAKYLSRLGARVRLFDVTKSIFVDNDYEYIRGDVTDIRALSLAMKGCDIVFHFAGLLGVEKILDRPIDVLRVNLEGTINALRVASDYGVERFILSSSSEIYGEPRKIPLRENDPPSPVSVYGVSKLAAETYCMAYSHKNLLDVTILRYFNVYGPGQSDAFVIPRFISRVIRGEPPIIYGQGSQMRVYTYVDDAVTCTVLAATRETGINQIFNVGTQEAITVAELAELIIEISGNHLIPIHKQLGNGIRSAKREIQLRIPDISKARRLLAYDPKVSLREGIERVYLWYLNSM